MSSTTSDSKLPALIAIACIAAGLIIGLLSGITHGTIAGGIIAALGAIPACFGMWKGIQQETQTTLAMSVIAVLACLGIGALLIVLRVVHWIA